MKPLPFRPVVLAVLALVAFATQAAPQSLDPPARVARLNYVRGDVSFRPATLEEWGPATINYPLTAGDRLWADADSVAEMHVGSSVIRLAPYTAFAFLNLDDRTVQMRLSEGSLGIVVRRLDYGEIYEVATPHAAVTLMTPGTYRIDVGPEGSGSRVTVRQGQAEVYGDHDEFRVYQGQTAEIAGDGGTWDVRAASQPDSWERWARSRDEREARSLSLRYVSHEMVGYEDLDEYGTWYSEPEYGYVWRPRHIPAGWAPYRHGHWAWIEPWGWTWVDDAPWGFAPFHYGRWAFLRSRWCWIPGAYVARPIYAPALVAFIGGRNWGFSFGVSFGRGPAIGWFPLGPREFYYPGYRASHVYIRNLNVTHVNVTNINITNYNFRNARYANRYVQGGVTAVPRDHFLAARSLRNVAVPVARQAVDRGELLGMNAGLAPRVESVMARRGIAVPRRAADALSRTVVTRTTPAAPVAPLRERVRAIEANAGQPVTGRRTATIRPGTVGQAADGLPVRQARSRATAGAVAGGGAGAAAGAAQRRSEQAVGATGGAGARPGAPGTVRQRAPSSAGSGLAAAAPPAARGSGGAVERRAPQSASPPSGASSGSTRPPSATIRSGGSQSAQPPAASGRGAVERRAPESVSPPSGAASGSTRPPSATIRSGGSQSAQPPAASGRGAVQRRAPSSARPPSGASSGSTRPPSATIRSGGSQSAQPPAASGRGAVQRRAPSSASPPSGASSGSTRPPSATIRSGGSQSAQPPAASGRGAVQRRAPSASSQPPSASRPSAGARSRSSAVRPPAQASRPSPAARTAPRSRVQSAPSSPPRQVQRQSTVQRTAPQPRVQSAPPAPRPQVRSQSSVRRAPQPRVQSAPPAPRQVERRQSVQAPRPSSPPQASPRSPSRSPGSAASGRSGSSGASKGSSRAPRRNPR